MSHKSSTRTSHWNARTPAPYRESFPSINSPWLFPPSSLRLALISSTMLYGTKLACTTLSHITPSQIYPLTPAPPAHRSHTPQYIPASYTNHNPLLNLGKWQNIFGVYAGYNQALYPLLPRFSAGSNPTKNSICSCSTVKSMRVCNDYKAESDPSCR